MEAWSREAIGRGDKETIACSDDCCSSRKKPAEVALEVGVARQTVYTWKALLDEGGIEALR
jgi:DNA-binding phage protein